MGRLRRDDAPEVVGCYPGDAGGTPLWRYRIPSLFGDLVGECSGRTKSEARADAKCRLGLGRGGLPVDTFLYRIH